MANDTVTLTVNGREVEAPRDQLLIHVLRDLGIRVPTLCHDDRLTPYGGCRLCVVERKDGRGGLVVSCSTPVQPGMAIETDTEAVVTSRRRQLQLLVINHRMECPTCERRGGCGFQDLLYEIGTPEEVLPFDLVRAPRHTASPVIEREPEKCIICGRCVRLCEEVQGVSAIGLVGRGLEAHVSTFEDTVLDCEFCGQCVNTCPVGALVARPWVSEVPPWMRTTSTTTCSFCSCGCELSLDSWQDDIVKVSGDPRSEPNRGKLCAKGWLGLDVLESPDRVTTPMVRRDGELVEVSWDEAIDAAVAALKDAGGSVLAMAGAQLSVEDGYRLQRLVRSVGSNDVHVAPTGGLDALTRGLAPMFDHPGSTAGYLELNRADLVFVVRGDPTRTHPLVKTEIVQGVTQRGQRLILAHGLSGGLERHAESFLALTPGTDAVLLNGLCAQILARSEEAFARLSAIDGAEDWRRALAPFTLETTSSITGVATEAIEHLAEALLVAERPVVGLVTGLGIPGDEAEAGRAAAALTALLGGDGGLMLLSQLADVQGLVDVGLDPAMLPGRRQVADEAHRQEIERLSGVAVPPASGKALDAGLGGEIATLWMLGVGGSSAVPGRFPLDRAASGARHVIVQDAFLSAEEAQWADVVLPVAMLAERRGSTVGWDGERRVLNPVAAAPNVPGDGDLIAEIARRLGAPQPDDGGLATELDAVVEWPASRPVLKKLLAAAAPSPVAVAEGMRLDVSPHLFHSGPVTAHSARLQELSPAVAVRLHPQDAGQLGVGSGDPVDLVAEAGVLHGRVRLDHNVRPGAVVAPWFVEGGAVSALMPQGNETVSVHVRRSQ
jgi:predicted molibdopterin-dependent oxidoreductase YjgC